MMNIVSTITKDEVLNAQNDWKNGIIDIGKKFINNEDYESRAIKHLNIFMHTNSLMFYLNQLKFPKCSLDQHLIRLYLIL